MGIINNYLPSPAELGLPSKYTQWRSNQDLACLSILDPNPRFLVQVCPTGFGKSLIAIAASRFYKRTVILTSTKGLQRQYMNDFGNVQGVVEIKGKANYSCRLNTKLTCDVGICSFGVKCRFREEGGCAYYDQLRRANRAQVVITNYAYWLSQNEFGEGIGTFDLMVLDEAHSSPDQVINHISVEFSKFDKMENKMLELDGSLPNDINTWIEWAKDRLGEVEEELEMASYGRKEKTIIKLKRLKEKLSRLSTNMDATWIWEDNSSAVILSPIWPAPYTEEVLFIGIPKVVFTSATVVPKTISLLGIESKENYRYEEWEHTFPLENRRVIHIPTVRMNFRNTALDERVWLTKMDSIIRGRIGTKGIIHTVSYARAKLIMEKSSFRQHMIGHKTGDTQKVVQDFKEMEAPAILVSPSMTTGWDFPDDELRWQIIIKLPFPDGRGEIMKTRSKKDKDYASYITMQHLIQTSGRGVRSATDWCETFVLDNNIEWFIRNNKHLSVEWFNGAYKVSNTIPTIKEEK